MVDIIYVVHTDLPPTAVDKLGLEIFRRWVAFARGQESLSASGSTPPKAWLTASGNRKPAGSRLRHPSGRYASAIHKEELPGGGVAIFADDSQAMEAAILEFGHPAIDLKETHLAGKTIPMHRHPGHPYVAAYSAHAAQGFPHGKGSRMSHQEPAGWATVGKTGWVIPPMAAYAPGYILAELAADSAQSGGEER